MPSSRILVFFAVAFLAGALLVLGLGGAGVIGAGRTVVSGGLLVALALVSVLLSTVDPPKLPVSEPARAVPPASIRASFGPAIDELESVALYTVDGAGHIGYFNRGAERLFGRSAREVEGQRAVGLVVSQADEASFMENVREVLETGKARPARRSALNDGSGRWLEAVVCSFPLLRYGKAVEVALLHVDARPPVGSEERLVRLLDSVPIALLGVDPSGRIEAVNQRFTEWTGRRADGLVGTDVERFEILPKPLRERVLRLATLRAEQGTPLPPVEEDVSFLTPAGVVRPLHALIAPRAGGGADLVLLDGTSRRRLLTELGAARSALAEAREAAAETIESTTRDLKVSVQEIVAAVARAKQEGTGPQQRATAVTELEESGRRFLAHVEAAALIPLREASGEPRKRGNRPRVLLVEDNDENRELLAHMLRSRGADVVAFGTGREALDAAARLAFDLVLLDVQMPEMDGYQVLRRIRSLPNGHTLPVVALTALTSELVREKCDAEGIDDFVSKPVTLARIGELLGKWSGRRRVPGPAG
jgi:PAS domain S-box-containing protein